MNIFPSFLKQLAPFTNPYLLIVCVCIMLGNASLSFQEFFLPISLQVDFDTATWLLSLIFLPMMVGSCLGMLSCALGGFRIGEYSFMYIGLIFIALAGLAFPASTENSYWLIMLTMIPFGLGLGSINASFGLISQQLLHTRRSSSTAYVQVLAYSELFAAMGYLIGTIGGSAIYEQLGYTSLSQIFAIALIAILTLVALCRKGRNSTIMEPTLSTVLIESDQKYPVL